MYREALIQIDRHEVFPKVLIPSPFSSLVCPVKGLQRAECLCSNFSHSELDLRWVGRRVLKDIFAGTTFEKDARGIRKAILSGRAAGDRLVRRVAHAWTWVKSQLATRLDGIHLTAARHLPLHSQSHYGLTPVEEPLRGQHKAVREDARRRPPLQERLRAA